MIFVVAIDGTAASGKGTLGKKIAEHFDFHYLDTGILYRVVAYNLKNNSDFSKISKQKVQNSLKLLNNKNFNITNLRNEQITLRASEISKNKIVRDNLLLYQRSFALQNGGAVLDGRDIGTVVCPDADVKIFVNADVKIRAKRRYDQLVKNNKDLNLKKILDDLSKRDNLDKYREFSPMVPAKDAFLLDTSNLTVEEALKKIIVIISKKFKK
jgi:cytidylate kinase